jgi:hypothetical protein
MPSLPTVLSPTVLSPTALSPDEFSLAELSALRLDGEVFALGDGFCSLDEPEDPTLRARAVLGERSARLIAELGTAAWIWGASPIMPPAHELCADHALRSRPAARSTLVVREVRFDPSDVTSLDGSRVTVPLRTSVDLARFRTEFTDDDARVCRELARIGAFGVQDCVDLMDRRPNLLEKRRARIRLTAALERS